MQATMPPTGPHILGFDVIWIATLLSAVATLAVMLAIYAATTVKDPMARRVKALNERREQLKAGIVAWELTIKIANCVAKMSGNCLSAIHSNVNIADF